MVEIDKKKEEYDDSADNRYINNYLKNRIRSINRKKTDKGNIKRLPQEHNRQTLLGSSIIDVKSISSEKNK